MKKAANVDAVVNDLVGAPPADKAKPTAPVNKGSKPPANKAKAKVTKGPNVTPSAADLARYAGKGKAKGGDAADLVGTAPTVSKPGKGTTAKKAAKAATPAAAKPAAKAKPAKAKGGTAGTGVRGQGKFYFAPDKKAALAAQLKRLKKPTTTAEYAAEHNVPTWQVRLAARVLEGEKLMALKQSGAVLTMHPK
jgi:hypothetical protein